MSLPTLSEILGAAPRGGATDLRLRVSGAWSASDKKSGEEARWLAAALLGYGLEPGACVGVLASEGRAALVAQLAVLSAGAVLAPLDPSASDDTLREGLLRTGASQAIASDERQLARLLSFRPDLPALSLVLLMTAAPSERRPAALLADAAIEVGRGRLEDDPDLLRRALADGDERSPAVRYPGDPEGDKAVPRSELTNLGGRIAESLGLTASTPVLVALPVSSLARIALVLAAIARGSTACLASPEERLDEGLAGLGPGAALVESGSIVRLHEAWSAGIDGSGWIARASTRWALRRGVEPARHPWAYRVAEELVLRKLRAQLGGVLKRIHVAGPPIHPETAAFFASIGVPLRPFEVRLAR